MPEAGVFSGLARIESGVKKRQRLAGSGLCRSDDIASSQGGRNGFALHGCWLDKSVLHQVALQ
jgi:hypothetical protein